MNAPSTIDILVVDENARTLPIVASMLDGMQTSLSGAASEADALRQMRETDFAMILLDCRTGPSDALACARRLRRASTPRRIPLLFLCNAEDYTAFCSKDAYMIAPVDHVAKPLIPEVLRAKVALFSSLHHGGAQNDQTTAALLESEARYRTLVDSMDQGYCLVDVLFDNEGRPHDYRFVETNRAFVGQTGLEDAIGRTIREMVPDHDQIWFEVYGRVAMTGEATRFVSEAKAMGRWYDVYAARMITDGANLVAIFFTDISARKRAEEERERLAAVVEQSLDFIGIADPDGGSLFLNQAGRRLVGIPGDADISQYSVLDFFDESDRELVRRTVIPSLLGGEEMWNGEVGFRHFASGKRIPVLYTAFGVRDADGKMTGLATITRDITEQKLVEEQLRRHADDLSRADRAKNEFLAVLAHELRNPLAPLRTGLEVMKRDPDNVALVARARGMMERQVDQLVRLVNDLLDVARITHGQLNLRRERVTLKSVVDLAIDTSMPLIAAGGHRLDVRLPDADIDMDVDRARIAQVISNLLNNAARYTPDGGRISLHAIRENGEVKIVVEDNGIGIDAKTLPKLFELFSQARPRGDETQAGLGIGLSLVRRLVQMHGGSVTAYSEGKGKGSRFTVCLNLPADAALEKPAPAPVSALSGTGKAFRILVVDDNRDAAEALSALLEMDGHTTRLAHDGYAALEAANEFKPEVVFLDIGLPGMSGYEVARVMRRSMDMEKTLLVALTGRGADEDRLRSRESGFDRHLTKPVRLAAVSNVLAELAQGNSREKSE